MDNPLKANPFRGMPKPAIYASIAGFTGIAGFLVYRHHKATGSWNPFTKGSATGTDAIDPVTGRPVSDDNVTDPLTGMTYLAEAQQYGSVDAAEAAVSAYGTSSPSGTGNPVNPVSPVPVTPGPVYTSNAAWAQAATAGLADAGFSETAVATALGDFLTQTPVTPDEKKLIDTAIAEYGPPPVGNLQVILKPPSKPGTETVTVPDLIGDPQADAFSALSSLGLKAAGSRTVKGEIIYVETQSPKAGTRVTRGSTVHLTSKPRKAAR